MASKSYCTYYETVSPQWAFLCVSFLRVFYHNNRKTTEGLECSSTLWQMCWLILGSLYKSCMPYFFISLMRSGCFNLHVLRIWVWWTCVWKPIWHLVFSSSVSGIMGFPANFLVGCPKAVTIPFCIEWDLVIIPQPCTSALVCSKPRRLTFQFVSPTIEMKRMWWILIIVNLAQSGITGRKVSSRDHLNQVSMWLYLWDIVIIMFLEVNTLTKVSASIS